MQTVVRELAGCIRQKLKHNRPMTFTLNRRYSFKAEKEFLRVVEQIRLTEDILIATSAAG